MVWYGRPTVRAWVDDGPSSFDQFVSELRSEHPDVPSADTLYVANLPPHLALFDGFYLPHILDSIWPHTDTDVEFVGIDDIEQRRATVGQNERLFVFSPESGACAAAAAQPAPSTEIPPPTRLQVGAVEDATAAAPVPLITFGPSAKGALSTLSWELDGAGRARIRFDIPWLPPQIQEWRPAEPGSRIDVALVAAPDADVYRLSVDGEPFAIYPLTDGTNQGDPTDPGDHRTVRRRASRSSTSSCRRHRAGPADDDSVAIAHRPRRSTRLIAESESRKRRFTTSYARRAPLSR